MLALVGARLTDSLLFGVRPDDTTAWVSAVVLLPAAGLMASGLPAWRAGRTELVESLRAE